MCRYCLLKLVTEGKIERRIEMMERWGRRHQQPLDDLKEMRRHWKLTAEALDHTFCRTRFGRVYGLVVRHNE